MWTGAVGKEIWAKPLQNHSVAVVLLNRDGLALVEDPQSCNGCGPCNVNHPIDAPCTDNATASVGAQAVALDFSVLATEWLLPAAAGESVEECEIFDVFATPKKGSTLGRMTSFEANIPPHGSRFLLIRNCNAAVHHIQ